MGEGIFDGEVADPPAGLEVFGEQAGSAGPGDGFDELHRQVALHPTVIPVDHRNPQRRGDRTRARVGPEFSRPPAEGKESPEKGRITQPRSQQLTALFRTDASETPCRPSWRTHVLLSMVAIWTVIGFIACLTGCDH
jgi:hypothetical protein